MNTRPSNREEVLALLKNFMESQKKDYQLTSLGIFGSFARDDAKYESDVDIVFETDAPNLFRTAKMKVELEALLSRPVDVIRLRELMDPRLKHRILNEALFV